jgi:uncharacterized membrane protein
MADNKQSKDVVFNAKQTYLSILQVIVILPQMMMVVMTMTEMMVMVM